MKVVDEQDRLRALDGEAVFVVHDDPEQIRRLLLHDLDVPYPILIDLDRRAYRAWGLTRASFWRVWINPTIWRRYLTLLLAGERPRGLGEDTLQLGGDFIIGSDGTIRYARTQKSANRPPVAELLQEMARAASPAP